MKDIKRLCIAIAIVLLFTTGCSSSTKYRDGFYTAQLPEFASNGWKEIIELTIEGGEIVKINWDAIYKDDSIPIRKKQYSKSGLYGMLAGGASNEWYDQATAAEQFVLENGIDLLAVTDDGYTDAVSSCTISVSDFDWLLRDCLEQAKK